MAGIPLIVAVPFPLSANVTVFGSDPVSLSAGIGLPVAVTLNVPFAPTVNVVLLPLVIAGDEWTVTVVVAWTVAGVVAELMTVSVYVVVVVGEMVTGVPLVTGPTPWSTLPVPLLNTAVSVVEVPETIVADAGEKLVITGAGTTVTVACAVMEAGVVAALVTVSVYVVVVVGEMLTGDPLVTAPTPLLILPVPPLKTAVSVAELPIVIVAGTRVKLVIAGAATTFSVKLCCALGFVPLFAVMLIG